LEEKKEALVMEDALNSMIVQDEANAINDETGAKLQDNTNEFKEPENVDG